MTNYDKKTGTGGTLRIAVTYSQDKTNNQTDFSVDFILLQSSSATWVASIGWDGSTSGTSRSGSASWTGGQTSKTVGSWNYSVTHDSDGYLSSTKRTFKFNMDATGTSGFGGPTSHEVTISIPRIPKEPDQVTGLKVVSGTVTTTGLKLDWTAPDNNGSSIVEYEVQWDTNSSFTSPGETTATATEKTIQTSLTPGTKFYFRVRAINSAVPDKTGLYSAVISQTTLPASPPGLAVTPYANGTGATLKFTAPGGVTGVTKYNWERRVQGSSTTTGSGSSTTTTATVNGLVPGTWYEWRAQAIIGTYPSPWTGWTAYLQPKPNISVGDYFDGSLPDVPGTSGQPIETDYGWEAGTVHVSAVSKVTSPGVDGWEAEYAGAGSFSISRVTLGGTAPDGTDLKTYSARVMLLVGSAGLGVTLRAGQANVAGKRSDAIPGAMYFGSMYVRPSMPNRLAIELTWFDSGGVLISRSVGTEDGMGEGQIVPSDGDWHRLAYGAEAPAGTAFVCVRMTDGVGGEGSIAWNAGHYIDLDGAMITLGELYPYFDGSTPDTSFYRYDWTGSPVVVHGSISTRTTLTGAGYDPLLDPDPDCQPPPAPPRAPIVMSACIEPPGIWRRYWKTIPATSISQWLAVVPSIYLQTHTLAVTQVRLRFYANPDELLPEDYVPGPWEAELIVSYMPPETLLTLDGVSQRAWAQVGPESFTNPAVPADKLLYGTDGSPATWPVLGCGQPYLLAVDTTLTSDVGDVDVLLALTERMG